MKIQNSTIDSYLLSFCILAPILPVPVAKISVFITFVLLFSRLVFKLNTFLFLNTKLLIIILLFPSVLLTAVYSSENLIRYIFLFFLILFYPYNLNFKKKYINLLSFLIIVYLSITQILIVLGNTFLIEFREQLYENEWGYVWDEGVLTSINLIGVYRSGGLFYNPNVLASLIILYFFIFVSSSKDFEQKKNFIFFLILSLAIISIILTDSRTVIVSFLGYYFLKANYKFLRHNFFFSKVSISQIIISLIVIYALYSVKDKILIGIQVDGSMYGKFNIFLNYIKYVGTFDFVFGGRHDIFFDTEYGYWLGALGLVGLIGLLIFIIFIYNNVPELRLYIITFFLLSVGNSLFYGLLTGSVATYLIIITCSLYYEKTGNIK